MRLQGILTLIALLFLSVVACRPPLEFLRGDDHLSDQKESELDMSRADPIVKTVAKIYKGKEELRQDDMVDLSCDDLYLLWRALFSKYFHSNLGTCLKEGEICLRREGVAWIAEDDHGFKDDPHTIKRFTKVDRSNRRAIAAMRSESGCTD